MSAANIKEYTFYALEDKARVIRNTSRINDQETYDFINLVSRRIHNYYTTPAGKLEYQTRKMGNNKLNLSYEIIPYPNDTINILGYPCYKVEILEREKTGKSFELVKKYELYVNDDLPLPFHSIIDVNYPIINLCALYMKITEMRAYESYLVYEAIEVNEAATNSIMELPKRYADAILKDFSGNDQ